MKNNEITFLILAMYFISQAIKAETFSVMLFQGANPPYTIIKNNQRSGIFVDLFKEISKITPHTFIFKDYPAARALIEFDKGLVDIEPGVNEQWRENTEVLGVYTIPYAISEEVIVFKKENKITVNRPEDLYGKTIGIVRGYSYPKFDLALNNGKIKKVNNRSESLLLKQLQADRVKYIFIGYRTIKYYIKQNPQYKDIIIGDIVSSVNVKIRIQPQKSYLVDDLNIAIAKLISTGKINDIYQKYQ